MSLCTLQRATCRPNTHPHQRLSFVKNCRRPEFPRRAFHATPPRLFFDECINSTHTLITGLHSVTGLPWAATLPMTAVIIRLLIVGPIATYSHLITQRRNEIFPLLYAWRAVITRNVMREHKAEGPVACEKLIAEKSREKEVEVRRRLGVEYWKSSLTWIQLPVFLVVIETVRSMCGTQRGLLGMIMRAPGEDAISEGDTAHPAVSSYLEQSLATEGALWFPDLLVPDPMLILPFTLSASLFATILFYDQRTRAAGLPLSKWQIRLQRIVKILALAIGPATLAMPSGMLLYWISSSLCAFGQNVFLEWYIPTKAVVGPCKPKTVASPNKAASMGDRLEITDARDSKH